MNSFSVCAAALVAATLLAPAAQARTELPTTIPQQAPSVAPAGYLAMCERSPESCAATFMVPSEGSGSSAMDSRAQLKLLRKINQRVNRNVVWRADSTDTWTSVSDTPGSTGDCEDFAITKRMELISNGFPTKSLSYAVVYLPRVGFHAVLVANVAGTDYVLDNRTPWVQRWSKTRYVWLLKQSASDSSQWFSALDAGNLDARVAPAA